MTNERRRRRWHWLACLVVAWSLVFLSIALCEAEQITSASPSGSQHHHHSDCHSLRPRLTVQKHLLPATHLDSRDRSVTVVVEWQLDVFLPDERGAWECRYVVRVTDSVPGLPLRVPNELAHLFATTHNNSYVHREYPITFNTDASSSSSSSIMKRDSWNYTLLIQPVSLSPLNDSLRLTLPSPQLTLLAAHADDTEARKVIDSAAPASPVVLTLSLYYAPASVSLYDALGLSLACMAAILVCHFLTAGRLDKAVRMREERVKQKKALAAIHAAEQSSPPTAAPVDTTAPAASAAQRSVVRDNLAVGGSATPAPPDDATSSSPSAPTPYRFKAKDTRKRFTRPQPSGGSMDF